MNIYQRMSAVQEAAGVVAKNLEVGYGKNRYKAVSERDILDTVKPLEKEYGIFSYPFSREILESEILTSETQNGTKTTFFTRIKTVYRFVNVDDPKEYVDITSFAEGIDPQDKGSGKAMTYADKYALMKAYKISTGDDPDQQASEPTYYHQPALICENCKQEITGQVIDGREYPADAVAKSAAKRFGIKLCYDCAQKFKAGAK